MKLFTRPADTILPKLYQQEDFSKKINHQPKPKSILLVVL